jgi:preprotein translocase subunit SecF
MQWIKPGTNIDFMGKTKLAVVASSLAVVISALGILVWPGPRLGVDFAGGAALQIKMKQGVTGADIQRALLEQGYESPEVVTAGDGSYLVRVRVQAPSDESRDALAQAVRGAVEKAPPVAPAAIEPAPAAVEQPAPAEAPAEAPAAPPPTFVTPLRGIVGALAGAKQAPDAGTEPTAAAPPEVAPPETALPAQPEPTAAAPVPAEGDAGAEPAAAADVAAAEAAPPSVADAELAEAPAADVTAVEEVAPLALVPADAGAPVEPPPPVAVTAPAPAAPAAVRVDEVIVDNSGAKVDILVNRPFTPEEIRDLLAPIQFQGRKMGDMIGMLVPDSDSITESKTPEGLFRYDVQLSPVVNLNDQDVGAVRDIVKGEIEAAGLAAVGDIRAIEVSVAPIGLRIDSVVALDRDGLARTMNKARYRDVNLFVRCRSAVCPASIDEREQVYGYQVNLRGFGPDVVESLQERLGKDSVVDVLSMEWVGPKVGEKLRDDGIKSVLIALGLILIYVALRFDLRFAPGAVLCLFHDATITLGFFTFTRMEVNLTTVAAILTIVGYSINDTIVVYDRIRENLQKTQERDLSKVINSSINDTLSRTLLTSFTTILAILAVAFFARGTIQDFAVAMTVGIVVGTYSSIYVAAPLSILIDKTFFHRNA